MLSDVQKPTSVQKRVVMFSNGNDNVIEKDSKKMEKKEALNKNANVVREEKCGTQKNGHMGRYREESL